MPHKCEKLHLAYLIITGTTYITVTFLVKMHKIFCGILLQIKAARIQVVQRSIAIFITNCLKVFPAVMRIFFLCPTIPALHKNTEISLNFLVWKFCGNAQFPHSFQRIVRKCGETVPFHKISTPGNEVKLSYFSQCWTWLTELIYSRV